MTAITNLPALAQTDVTGGTPVLVIAVFVLLAIATMLSLIITYRFAKVYFQTGTRPLLLLATGLFLLTAAPIFARLVFANVTELPGAYRTLITSGSELLGLLIILYTIYR